jgi:general secretion pathway protein H
VKAMRHDRNCVRGFTLLELLVVMLIAGLMLALAPPLFSGAVTGARLKGSARDLVTSMREIRSRAILRNAEQHLRLDLESRRFDAGDGRLLSLPDGIEITVAGIDMAGAPEPGLHVLRFFPDGGSSGETVSLSSGDRVYRVGLNWLTGQVTVSEGAGNDA